MGIKATVCEPLIIGLRHPTTDAALAAGTVNIYAAGTTTDKTIWADANKSSENVNPVTLDSFGQAEIYGDGLYRLVVKDSTGATIYDWDNFPMFGETDLALTFDLSGYPTLANNADWSGIHTFDTALFTGAPIVISNVSGTTSFAGLIIASGNVEVSGTFSVGGLLTAEASALITGPTAIGIQGAVDGGSTQGIFLWQYGNTSWGIYISQPGGVKSLNDASATGGILARTQHQMRFRAAAGQQNGFIFENDTEQCMFQIMSHASGSSLGNAYLRGDLFVGNQTSNPVATSLATATFAELKITGNAEISGTLGVEGTLTASGAFTVHGITTLPGGVGASLQVRSASTPTGEGLEFAYNTGTDTGEVFAYSRTSSLFQAVRIRGNPITISAQGSNDFTRVTSTIQLTSANAPTSGIGLELEYDTNKSVIRSFSRTSSVYKPLEINGTTIKLIEQSTAVPVIVSSGGSAPMNRIIVASAYTSGNTSIGDASSGALSFDTEEFDTHSIWASGSPTRFTVPGNMNITYARVHIVTVWQGTTTGVRIMVLRKNGVTLTPQVFTQISPDDANTQAYYLGGLCAVTSADYLEVWVYQNSGGALNVTSGSFMKVEFM